MERSNRETVESLGGVEVGTLPLLDVADSEPWPALLPKRMNVPESPLGQ